MTCLSLTLREKLLNLSNKKCFNAQDECEKIYLGISAEGQWQKHEMQVALKKVYWKNKSVPNIWAILPLKKGILSELNKCTFQISLKYIKLVFKNFIKYLSWFCHQYQLICYSYD